MIDISNETEILPNFEDCAIQNSNTTTVLKADDFLVWPKFSHVLFQSEILFSGIGKV